MCTTTTSAGCTTVAPSRTRCTTWRTGETFGFRYRRLRILTGEIRVGLGYRCTVKRNLSPAQVGEILPLPVFATGDVGHRGASGRVRTTGVHCISGHLQKTQWG
jgi:hypothetical protein